MVNAIWKGLVEKNKMIHFFRPFDRMTFSIKRCTEGEREGQSPEVLQEQLPQLEV